MAALAQVEEFEFESAMEVAQVGVIAATRTFFEQIEKNITPQRVDALKKLKAVLDAEFSGLLHLAEAS